MSPYLAPGMGKLPSDLELQMLADIRNSRSTHLATSTRVAQGLFMLGITNDPKTSISSTNCSTNGTAVATSKSPIT